MAVVIANIRSELAFYAFEFRRRLVVARCTVSGHCSTIPELSEGRVTVSCLQERFGQGFVVQRAGSLNSCSLFLSFIRAPNGIFFSFCRYRTFSCTATRVKFYSTASLVTCTGELAMPWFDGRPAIIVCQAVYQIRQRNMTCL